MTEAIKKLYEIAKKHQVAVRIYIDPRYIFDNPISISVYDGYRKYGATFTGEMLAGIKDGDDYNDELLKWRDSASDYFILDSGKGSGKTFDWNLIDKNSEFFRNSIFLAGGLNSENLTSAIEEFNPFAVDLSSSVETDGFKDEEKIKEIIEIMENYR